MQQHTANLGVGSRELLLPPFFWLNFNEVYFMGLIINNNNYYYAVPSYWIAPVNCIHSCLYLYAFYACKFYALIALFVLYVISAHRHDDDDHL